MVRIRVALVQIRRKEEGEIQADVGLSDVLVPLGVENSQFWDKDGPTEVLLESGCRKQTESRTVI